MSILYNTYLFWTAKFVIGFVFIFAGMEKIIDPAAFSDAIANYKLLPYFSINFFAIVLPWIEIAAGFLLIFDKYVKENAFIFSSLLLVFTVMIFIAVLRGLDIECGCFGTIDAQKVGIGKILENIGLLILGVYVYLFSDDSENINYQPNK